MNQPNPYIFELCNQLEIHLGFKIKNIANAQKCSEVLALEKLYISKHTIARLYGIVKPFRTPYKDTLNLISRFLKYSDWDDFCNNQTNVPFDPNFYLTEANDGFSLAVLQLALANEDLKAIELILDKVKENKDEAILYTAAELLGTYVRKSKKQKKLLQLLAKSNVGQQFFYECYVDENNENNYFSEALQQYYLPNITNEYRKLYVYCFAISQTAHKENQLSNYSSAFLDLIPQLEKSKCHFHELSRWIECLILIDGFNKVIEKTWEVYINEIITLSKNLEYNEKIWLFSRSLKAFVLFGFKEELFNNSKLNIVIEDIITKKNKYNYNTALYVIQLYWISKSIYFKNKTIYTPFRIHNILFQNESNENSAIEFAVASLFATGENKQIITGNLKRFCEENGVHWVVKMLT